MFTKDAHEDVDAFIIVHWLLMSLFAGLLNAIAFIGFGTFATHVTGFATLIGVNLAEQRLGNTLTALAVPLFFLSGAVISGLLIEARVRRNKIPHYDYVMYFSAAVLALACVIGQSKTQVVNPSYLHLENNFILLSAICLASGLVNATLSYSSHSTVRITHLTGITTDLGRGIAEIISLKAHKIQPTKSDFRLNLLRSLTILSFILGGVIGAFLFHLTAFYGLLLPAAYFAYAGHHGRRSKKKFILSGQSVQ